VRELRVEIPDHSYQVYVGVGLLERAHELIPTAAEAELVAHVSDARAAGFHGARAEAGLAPLGLPVETFSVEPGEESKTVAHAEAMWRWLSDVGSHRRDFLAALGGGVVTDLVGFVAANYHRGIGWVAMPTTLLAQIDAAIGGKTGVNLPGGKNLVGAFHQPIAVIADVGALATLPGDVFATGMAEVIKHGLIAAPELLERARARLSRILARDPEVLEELVADAAAVKVAIVRRDPTERGEREHLNYGHTLGHALEALGEYSRFVHGQAVALGMMFAAHLAAELGYPDRVSEHRAALDAYGLPTSGAREDFEAVAAAWARDKKYHRGIRFVVLEDLGRPAVVRDVPESALQKAYEAVR
jgi:3-dehydroquinate synthase